MTCWNNEHRTQLNILEIKFIIYIYIDIYAFSRHFYSKQLTVHSGYAYILSKYISKGAFDWNVHRMLVTTQVIHAYKKKKKKVQKLSYV